MLSDTDDEELSNAVKHRYWIISIVIVTLISHLLSKLSRPFSLQQTFYFSLQPAGSWLFSTFQVC